MKIGKAKFGGDFVKRKYWQLKDGESVYRILPPMGDLAESGKWSQFYNVHYGYKNSKGEMRVFQSPLVKNRKTKMVEVPDAALERIEMLKSQLEKAKASGNKAVVDMLTELVGGQKPKYNLDNNHYVNAMDQQGNIGILKLRHRAKLALDAKIKELRDKGIEPLDVTTGRFFKFIRNGMGLDTSFQVETLKKSINVQGLGMVEQEIVHVLDDGIIARLEKEAAQLDKLYKRPTAEEVAEIVKQSDIKTGKSPAIDMYLDAREDDTANDDDGSGMDDDAPAAYSSTTATTTAAATAPATVTAPVEMQAPVATPAPVAAVTTPAPVAAAPAQSLAAPTKTATTVTTPVTATQQDDLDFLKSLGL